MDLAYFFLVVALLLPMVVALAKDANLREFLFSFALAGVILLCFVTGLALLIMKCLEIF